MMRQGQRTTPRLAHGPERIGTGYGRGRPSRPERREVSSLAALSPTENRGSLRAKVLAALFLVTAVVGIAAVAIVVITSVRASEDHLGRVQRYIEQGITSKGKVLTENHGRALLGLTLDNAFLDMQRLMDRAVHEDSDVVFGLYVSAEHQALALSRAGHPSATQPPKPDAWKALGITKDRLLVRSIGVKRTARLGQDLVEVAAPVQADDGEVLGTVRYGLSTRRMHEGIAQARANARARLTTSVTWVVILVTAAALLALFVSRLLAARITRPVGELTLAAWALAAGDRKVRVAIDSSDELESLGASFNSMVEDLDRSYRALEEMNRTLEQKVERRTVELARANRDMRLVLDNVDQGFVTVTPDGIMALERSRVVCEWFGGGPEKATFTDYIQRTSRGFALAFELAWEQLLDGFLPLELCVDQLPKQLVAKGRTWSFRYLPFCRDDKLEGVLIVIAEITDQLARQQEEAEQAELMQGFKRIIVDRSGFGSFLRDADVMVEALRSRRLEGEPVDHRRTLHTLKGNAASMGLTVVARLCHGLEEQLDTQGVTTDEALGELASRWKTIRDHVAAFGGDAPPDQIEVPEADYAGLVSRLAKGASHAEVLDELLSWQLEPGIRPLRRLADQATALARRLDKGEIEVDIQARDLRLDPDFFRPLFSEMVHVVRNAVDHGLEPPEERSRLGKTNRGVLVLKAAVVEDTLTLEVSDDGRGIDWERVAEKAAERGLPYASHGDLVRALLTDGITTRDNANLTSGRGVGMSVVAKRVEIMNGSIDVQSVRGVGTTWSVRFPCVDPAATGGKVSRFSADGRSYWLRAAA